MNFSVLMAVHDGDDAKYFHEALKSLATQTVCPSETVIVEDGPIRASLDEVITDFQDELPITRARLETNSGLAVALNEGLKHCSNEIVARMDSDDIAEPARFEKQLAFMAENDDVSVSSGTIIEIDQDKQQVGTRVLPESHDDIVRFAKMRNPISHPASIFRKSAVLEVGGYPLFRRSQDYALWSLMLSRGHRFANLNDVLLHMRAGSGLMKRRGYQYFKKELEVMRFQREIGFLSLPQYGKKFLILAVLRLSPDFLKKLMYRYAR